jgi:hypothetical protein
MRISVSAAVEQLVAQELIERERHGDPDSVVDHVCQLIGRAVPSDLADLYREEIRFVGDFRAVYPTFNQRMGWDPDNDATITRLLDAKVVPIFFDGVGNLYAFDVDPAVQTPAVYLFDHEREFALEHIAGTSLGSFLLILGDMDRAIAEDWPEGWQLRIDPDLDKSSKAPPEWKIKLW